MRINCLSCGHKVDLDDAYDNYAGQIKCFTCGAILEIKTQEGELKAVEFVKLIPRPSTEEASERTRQT